MNRFFLGLAASLVLVPTIVSAQESLDDFLQGFNPQKKEYKLKYNKTYSQNKAIFGKYCKGNVSSHKAPKPRYSNSLVKAAALKIGSTDKRAYEVLQERAREQMKMDMGEALSLSKKLKDESKNLEVKSLATSLYDEINAETVFDDSMESKAQKISVKLTKEIKPLVDELVVKLENDLTGIDNKKFKKAVNDLYAGLNVDLEKVSFAKLKDANAKVKAAYEAMVGQADKVKIQDLAEKISKEVDISLEAEPGSWDFKYMKEEADSLAAEAKNNGITENTYYFMSGVLQYYTYDELNHTDDSVAYGKELGRQITLVRSKFLVDLTKKLADLLNDADENNVEDVDKVNIASNRLHSNLRSLNKWVEGELADTHKSFAIENSKFQTNSVLARALDVKNKANAEDWQNAHSAAQNLKYYLDRVESAFSESTRQAQKEMNVQLAKLDSDRIKQTAKELQGTLAGVNDIEEETSWRVQDFASTLRQGLDLTTAKDAAESYVAVAADVRLAQGLKRLTKTRIEDAKPGMHYYFYGHVWKHYNENGEGKPWNISWNAHKFIKQLCGEYRDRATMIEAKLKWIAKGLFILPKKEDADTSQITAQTKNVWSKVNASWYYPYIDVTSSLWDARRASQDRYIKVGSTTPDGTSRRIDNPVKGTTVCETKYIFARYVAKGKTFSTLQVFMDGDGETEGYKSFEQDCSLADRTDYYDFRGDSNFKHYSPESNGMIWYANNLGRACSRTNKKKGSASNYESADCEEYFKNPFAMRYAGARALFASWLFRAPEHDAVFGNSGDMVAIYSHRKPRLAPYSFGFDQTTLDYHFEFDPEWKGIPLESGWLKSDMGYNQYTGLSAGELATDEAKDKSFLLISNAVDRHTDWYASGYNDGNGFVRDQATSPFVASSYVMSSSDAFTTCGITVQCPPDGLKRWMFVFRIKGDNWYGPHRIENGDAIDFDRHWFDETSFGFTGLADGEHAWDRLGTALEEELDSILYLVNVDGGGEFEEGH